MADGAIVEPLAVALHGLALSRMKIGDKVLVLGRGTDRSRRRVLGPALRGWARGGAGPGGVAARPRALQMGAHDFVVDAARSGGERRGARWAARPI